MGDTCRVLIVDDEPDAGNALATALFTDHIRGEIVTTGEAALAACHQNEFDVVLSDIRMQGMDGLELVRQLKRAQPDLPIVLVTGDASISGAVGAIKLGAYQYVTKPCDPAELQAIVERAWAARPRVPKGRNRSSVPPRSSTAQLTGSSPAMNELRSRIELVAATAAPVLITGETGTGKELVARAIHASSPRSKHPFITVNTSAIPEALLESEMFGHVRGAFTGATHPHRGYFAHADGGTLLLDEIGDMPLTLQTKLLRVLQEGEYRPVGGEQVERVDVRIVAATHRRLLELVKAGTFREDLYYRLNVIALEVPPLRNRREDIPELARLFLSRARQVAPQSCAVSISDELLTVLANGSWPGNVRELESIIERMVVFATNPVLTPRELSQLGGTAPLPAESATVEVSTITIDAVIQQHVETALAQTGGNKAEAAKRLGVDLSTLYRWLQKWR